MDSERYFIINKMYAGSYLDDNDSQNIGHEVINLFSDDKGGNYIYVNKSGVLPAKYDDKIEAVILTRQYGKGCQEVLGIATIDKQMLKESLKDKTIDEQVKDYEHEIKYGGHPIINIFSNNIYNGEKDSLHYVTFKTKVFYKPIKQLLLADVNCELEAKTSANSENDYFLYKLPDYDFGHQSLRLYISSEGETKSAFKTISEILNDRNIMQEYTPEKVDFAKWEEKNKNGEAANYLIAMSKIDSENIFSNLLCFFLNADRDLLKFFCEKVLGIDIDEKASIERERAHTDIWIEDSNNIVVIENKIKSGLNGKDGGQLKVYAEEAIKASKEGNKSIHRFIFAPNHNKQIPLVDNQADGFKMIRYSELYKILSRYIGYIHIPEENDKYNAKINLYYADFMQALKTHSENTDTTKQDIMERLFYKRLFYLNEVDEAGTSLCTGMYDSEDS